MVFCFIGYLFFIPVVQAHSQADYELPLVVKLGATEEVVQQDFAVPAQTGVTSLNSGSGFLQNTLQNQLAVPMTTSGKPGNLAQMRGVGLSSEEVDVQAFGVSLNSPQGGGFDLSIFPQFLWSSYQYQSGPVLNSLNSSASTASLRLVSWTEEAITQSGFIGRWTEFYSTTGLNQISVAAKGKNTALVAGYSSVRVVGPSGGLSSRWGEGTYLGSLHLLATDLTAETPGSTSWPTPQTRMHTFRVIPVLQNDFQWRKNHFLKTSLFFDYSSLNQFNSEDPLVSFSDQSRSTQWGLETAYGVDQWKISGSGRKADYVSNDFQTTSQGTGNFQFSRVMDLGFLSFEPMIQGIWITDYGFYPQGSVGARVECEKGRQLFYSRMTYSKQIPTLLDRYSNFTSFKGNPNLKAETDWTAVLGWQRKTRGAELSIQFYGQLRKDPRVLKAASAYNLDSATVVALSSNGKIRLSSALDITNKMTLSDSHLSELQTSFPYVPALMNILGMCLHSNQELRFWELSVFARYVSSQLYQVSSLDRLPSYLSLDLGMSWFMGGGITLSGRVENSLNRSIEMIQGYPFGRSFSALLVGEI